MAHTPVTIGVTVNNHGDGKDELFVEEILPDGLMLEQGHLQAFSMIRGQDILTWEYGVVVRRGEYRSLDTRLAAGDVFGCFEERLTSTTQLGVTAHPIYVSPGSIPIRPPQTRGFAGPIAARQAGAGVDFFGVREYQAGDPPRQVNWKLAARGSHDLYTNVFEQERVADVGIILDSRQVVNLHGQAGSLFEYSVQAAAGMAESFLEDGNRVSLVVYGSGMETVFPGYGRRQRNRILRTLARVKPGINYALGSLAHLPTRLFPARSQIVLVSPLVPEDVGVILRMRARGYSVLVVSPDPVAYEAVGNGENASVAFRLARAERRYLLQQVRRAGAQVVDWQVDHSLDAALHEELTRHPLLGHLRGGLV